MNRRTRTLALVAVLALAASPVLAGCSGDGGDSSMPSDSGGLASSSVSQLADRTAAATEPLGGRPPLVISTGTVELRARDVAGARARVLGVVTRFHGEVAQQQSESDGHGELSHTRLVARIPSSSFTPAVNALEHAGTLVYSDTRAEDVTTRVIDTRVDLRVQRRSIARVETLLGRARTIHDIVAIEAQLSRRQARLGSLERRAAYLADRTAMSTVTISVDRRPRPAATTDRGGGFVGGLRAGWDGLSAVALVLATTAGAVLPFAVLLLVLLVPAWPLVRRLRRRREPHRSNAPA